MRFTALRFITAAVLSVAAITVSTPAAHADYTYWDCANAAWHDCYDATGGTYPEMADCYNERLEYCVGLPGDPGGGGLVDTTEPPRRAP